MATKAATTETTTEDVVETPTETPEANVVPAEAEAPVAPTTPVEEPVAPTPPPRATAESVRPNIVAKEYRYSPIPKTCQWLELHGVDPSIVSLGIFNKSGFTTLQGDHRNWPFPTAEIDELIALYESEMNAPEPVE